MGVILLRFAQNTKLWVCLCGWNWNSHKNVRFPILSWGCVRCL